MVKEHTNRLLSIIAMKSELTLGEAYEDQSRNH